MSESMTESSLRPVKPGEPVGDFEARNQEGKILRLSDFRGKPVLLFFYPKDDTPGCTREACSFRDDYDRFLRFDAVILGVSAQGEASHRRFREKFKLPFDLLVDETGDLARRFDVGRMPLLGHLLGLYKRESVLIDPDGRLVRRYTTVDPAEHSREVLEDLARLGGAAR